VLRAAPVGDCFSDTVFGACRKGQVATNEYSWEVPGPEILAIHVLDGLAAADMPADVAPIDSPPIDTTPPTNAGVIGASVFRAQKQTFVLEPATLPPPATLSYSVPGGSPSRHVVFDAPADAMNKTRVTAMASGTRCVVMLAAGGDLVGAPAIFTLKSAAEGCAVSADADVAPGKASPGTGGYERPNGGAPAMGGMSGGSTGGSSGTGSGGSSGGAGTGGGEGGAGPGGGQGGNGSGPGVGGGTAGGAGSSPPGSGNAEGGCSCELGRGPRSGLGALASVGVIAVLVRRRRKSIHA
jgi:MYXO-CTERM domain-containing protein